MKLIMFFLLPIYAAREVFDPSVTHTLLAEQMQKRGVSVEVVDTKEEVVNKVRDVCGPGTVVLTMGAGDVWRVAHDLIES